MKLSIFKLSAYVSTSILLVLFFVIQKDDVFHSIIGLFVGLLWVYSLVSIMRSMLLFDDVKIQKGYKHTEKTLALFLLVNVGIFVAYLLYYLSFSSMVNWVSVWILTGLLMFVVVVTILSFFMNYVVVDEKTITYLYVGFSKNKTIQFDEIMMIRFGGLMNTFKLRTKDTWVLIDVTLKNADAILNAIYRNTSYEIHKQAFQQLKRYYTLFGVKRNLEYLDFFKEPR